MEEGKVGCASSQGVSAGQLGPVLHSVLPPKSVTREESNQESLHPVCLFAQKSEDSLRGFPKQSGHLSPHPSDEDT